MIHFDDLKKGVRFVSKGQGSVEYEVLGVKHGRRPQVHLRRVTAGGPGGVVIRGFAWVDGASLCDQIDRFVAH